MDMSAGQPPLSVQAMIDQEILFYFERGIGEMECVSRTKHSWRTVHARYNKFFNLLSKGKDDKFLVEQEKSKAQALVALDKQLTEMLLIQQQTTQRVGVIAEQAKDQKRAMTKEEVEAPLRAKLSWMISDITDKKAGLAMMPATAEYVRNEVNLYIESIQKSNKPKELQQLS